MSFYQASPNIGARFQQVNAGAGSDKLRGVLVSETEPMPEPLTILGSAAALGVGTVLKRKAARKS